MLLESAYDLLSAPGAVPPVLKHCKLQYKLDLTLKKPSVCFIILIEMLLPGVLKHCKLQYKMDITLKNPSVFHNLNRTFAELIDFYNRKPTLASPMSPWQPLGSEV